MIESWFAGRGWVPWEFQRAAWDAFSRGESGLIQVSTGAGKTFGAYMGPLAALIDEVEAERRAGAGATAASAAAKSNPKESPSERAKREARAKRRKKWPVEGLRILYVTPLRAVSRDIEAALREPVMDLGLPITVESRTGDTKASVRAKQREELPNVLVTTPESLSLLLTREDARAIFGNLRSVIVDEWHELLATKRGTQVELALARLREFSPGLRSWALSATLPNLEVAAKAIAGVGGADGAEKRPTIVRGDMPRPVVIDSILPEDEKRLPWAGHLGLVMLPEVVAALDPREATLIFTNTRSQAERWFHAILVQKPEWAEVMALHHGSIDRAERERVEAGLKNGSIRIVVATSSLDLGVDFTPVERVLQVGSPKGIARLVQRAGRSSHKPKTPCRVTCVPTHMLELVEIAAAKSALKAGDIESRVPMQKPLDVLTQHLVTCGLGGGFDADELFEEVRTAYSYRDLTREEFGWCLALVMNGGGTLSAYEDYHRVALVDGRYKVPSRRIAQLHRLNVGTITADTTIEIMFRGGRSLGRIEEGFIAGLQSGQKFVFAGKVLEFVTLRDLIAYVRPARGTTNFTPIWGGTKLPISESLAAGIRSTLERASDGVYDTPELERARKLVEVQARESIVPRHDETLVELARTREGWHLFIYPFEGRSVHGGLAALIAYRLANAKKASFSVALNDYGLEIMAAEEFPFAEMVTPKLFSREGLVDDVIASMNSSQLARLQFREIARVSGLVFQNYPGAYKSGRQVQASAGLLFDVLTEFDPGNLLLVQAKREVLERQFEQSRFARTLERIENSRLRIVRTRFATPLCFPLLIERQAARLSTQSVLERMEAIQSTWERAEQSSSSAEDGSFGEIDPAAEHAPPSQWSNPFGWEPPPGAPSDWAPPADGQQALEPGAEGIDQPAYRWKPRRAWRRPRL